MRSFDVLSAQCEFQIPHPENCCLYILSKSFPKLAEFDNLVRWTHF